VAVLADLLHPDLNHIRGHHLRLESRQQKTEITMYDPTYLLDQNERATERGYDLNRETAPEMDGITPANVPVWTALRVENMDGTTNVNATINALCEHVRELEEASADAIRDLMHDREILSDVRDQFQSENHGLRQKLTLAEMLLRVSRERWDERSTGVTLLELDILLGNPEAREMKEAA
jgi:hypothetical protein